VCFSNSNVCVLMHDSQQQIETLMKNMAHVAEQEVMCHCSDVCSMCMCS
jgi:hypothetical protein